MANPISGNRPAKKWVFTLNNPQPEEIALVKDLECAHLVFGEEVGANGTPHLQGYINFRKAKRMTGLKKILPRAHWEICKESEAAINYCKKDGKYFEKDTRHQGKRNDWDDIKEMAYMGKFGDIAKKYPGAMARYGRGIVKLPQYRNISLNDRDWVTEVHVRYGEPGSGKTRWFYEQYPDLWPMHRDNNFWSEYYGQETVLFDDFDGSWIKRSDFLKLTDRYAMQIRQIGGWANWNPRRILITSNWHPDQWYRSDAENTREAVRRRLTTVTHVATLAQLVPEVADMAGNPNAVMAIPDGR